MRVTFRFKLLGIVGLTVLALLTVLITGLALERREQQELVKIKERYIPRVDLAPQLESRFEAIRRGLQDAVSARDEDGLVSTERLKDELVTRLTSAGADVVNPAQALEASRALEEYYQLASSVSRRLMANETGEVMAASLATMQAKQQEAATLLRRVTAFDRTELSRAFDAAKRAQATAAVWRMAVSVACMLLVILLSVVVSRSVLRSLTTLSEGLERFGRGDLDVPVSVRSSDEVGDLARVANQMAASLKKLLDETRRQAEQLAKQEVALRTSNELLWYQQEELRRTNEDMKRTMAGLEAFNYSVSHDLRAPLRSLSGFSKALVEDYGDKLDGDAKNFLLRIQAGAERMGQLIEAMLRLARLGLVQVHRGPTDIGAAAAAISEDLRQADPDREVELRIEPGLQEEADAPLVRIVLENLLRNAWKFTRRQSGARIEVGRQPGTRPLIYFVRDNGVGFDPSFAEKLFQPFQRLHSDADFEGTGVGLATVSRIVERHGGRLWAQSAPNQGATFFFTLQPQAQPVT